MIYNFEHTQPWYYEPTMKDVDKCILTAVLTEPRTPSPELKITQVTGKIITITRIWYVVPSKSNGDFVYQIAEFSPQRMLWFN